MNAISAERLIALRIQESIALCNLLLECREYLQTVTAVAAAMANALRCGGKILFFGNGGSAADAQHLAAELTGRFLGERASLAGLALTANTSALTAIGNDYSFREIFSRQIQGLGSAGDLAIGISTSGSSPNVLHAMEVAREKKLVTVGLTGSKGEQMRALTDHCILIPSNQTPHIQEGHILTGHILCELMEQELFRS
jgi:D-sedoheptulose 7-phosphate isomerase